ncbi:hypothetical protein NVS55_14050 [Myxococcus stipitatus]|uniref:hypothetical protein n=1 Tax=Myxococcus stipitatus TaxID=83455 RepID=UPI0031455D9C
MSILKPLRHIAWSLLLLVVACGGPLPTEEGTPEAEVEQLSVAEPQPPETLACAGERDPCIAEIATCGVRCCNEDHMPFPNTHCGNCAGIGADFCRYRGGIKNLRWTRP